MEKIKRRKSVCYCINMRRAANIVTNIYDDILQPVGLTVNQYSLLTNIGRLGICSVSDLASYVGLDRSTLVRTLQPLINYGYIEDISESSERNRKMQLTQLGGEIITLGIPLWEKAQLEMEKRIGKERLSQLSEIMSLLVYGE